MVTLLGSLLGFVGAAFPDLLKLLRESQDKKHEITILKLQLQQQQQGYAGHLEEIKLQDDAARTNALYRTYYTGIKWVDALNGTVRPIVAYAFFMLYALVKVLSYYAIPATAGVSFAVIYATLWTNEDSAIFAGIISFYFGQRAMQKMRNYTNG